MVVSANDRRNAGGVGDAQRRHAGAGLDQQRIDVAVIAAFELDGEVAAGESARHAQRAHGGFGAGVDQAHHLHGRNDLRDQLGELDFALGGRAEAGAGFENIAQSVDDLRRTMAQQQRPPGADVVDIGIAVRVEDARALRRDSMNRGVPPTPRKARTGELTPPGITCLGAREQRFGSGVFIKAPCS